MIVRREYWEEEKMKKLLTLLLSLLMIVSLAGCAKKKSVTVKVTDQGGNNFVVATETDAKNLKELLEEVGNDDNVIKEITNGAVAIPDAETDYWKLTVNGNETTGALDTITVNDGDVYEIVYTEVEVAEQPAEQLAGGWQTWETFNELLTDEETEIFNKAMEGLVGVGYNPIRVLATQLVNGTNYAYLAQGTTITAVPVTDYYIVVVYKDMNGNAELKAINKLEVPDLMTKENADGDMVGAWTVQDTGKAGMFTDENAQATFDAVTGDLVGVLYNPIQLLATQVVNGTNYMGLALGKTADAEATVNLYVVTWYADLQGNATLTDIKILDLNYYTAGE